MFTSQKEDSEEKDVEIDNLAVGNWDTETPSQHSSKHLQQDSISGEANISHTTF